MKLYHSPVALALVLIVGCNPPDSVITATLSPGDFDGESRLRWSPKGEKVELQAVGHGLEGSIILGSEGMSPFLVRLEKSGAFEYFDVLKIDFDRDRSFGDDESITTTPNELRYKMWSSFKSSLDVSVEDPENGEVVINPYPLSLWYVEDLREEHSEQVLRFSRSGWMQGRVMIDGIEAHIRVSESKSDGIFTQDDSWTLTLPDSVQNIFAYQQDRPGRRHAWLGEKAYRIVSMNPTGRSLTLEFVDPGVTRAKEAEDDDQMAVDRRAPHSGRSVGFGQDFDQAEIDARTSGKTLFIDFETVWCGPCKSMEEWVYTADSVVEASENMVSVKVDGDDFPDIADRFEVVAFPTMILLSPEGEVTGRLVGYQGVEAMTEFLSR